VDTRKPPSEIGISWAGGGSGQKGETGWRAKKSCFLEVSISWAGGESGKGANLGGGEHDVHEAIYFELQMGKLMGIIIDQ